MRDYVSIGASPPDEDCVALGQPDYERRAREECRRYIEKLREFMGREPEGALLAIKGFNHDFGRYYEVVCWYDDAYPGAADYAFACESDGPETWDEEAPGGRCESAPAGADESHPEIA